MICEAAALKKYIDKSNKIFFIFGSEIVLKNNSVDLVNEYFQEKGYTERETIFEQDFKNIEETIIKNAGGSLFGSKTIIEILHNGGKIPKEISNIFEIENAAAPSNTKTVIIPSEKATDDMIALRLISSGSCPSSLSEAIPMPAI